MNAAHGKEWGQPSSIPFFYNETQAESEELMDIKAIHCKSIAAAFAAALVTVLVSVGQTASAQEPEIPAAISTPDQLKSPMGTLEFTDGVPSVETADKVYEMLDLVRGVNVFNNSFRGASAYAIRQGFHSIGAEDNTVVIFPKLMDSNSLFLTGNADTVYYLSAVDLSQGPMVIEQPPMGLGTINDMWFSWVIDIGFPGPDRGAGGRYLVVPPGYEGDLPEGGFYVAHSRTNHVLYAARAFLVDNDPKPTVENIKKNIKIYPYTPGGEGTSIATALQGKVRLGKDPAIPATKFVDGSGKSFNTIPPSDFSFFEMINANVQDEPVGSYDVELAGQLAAIGIVKGKPFKPDAMRKKVLANAAAIGSAAGRRSTGVLPKRIPSGLTIPIRCGAACCGREVLSSKLRRRCSPNRECLSPFHRPAPGRSIRGLRSTSVTRSTRRA